MKLRERERGGGVDAGESKGREGKTCDEQRDRVAHRGPAGN